MSSTVQCMRCQNLTPADATVAPGHVRCVHCKALVCLPDSPSVASGDAASAAEAVPPPVPASAPAVSSYDLLPYEEAMVAVLELVKGQGLNDLVTWRDCQGGLGQGVVKKDRRPGEKFLGDFRERGVAVSNLRLAWKHASLAPDSGQVLLSALDPEQVQGRNGLFKHTLTLGPGTTLVFSGLATSPRSFTLISSVVRLLAIIVKDTSLAHWQNNPVLAAACPNCSAANGVTGVGLGGSTCVSCSRTFQPDLGKISWGALAADGLRGTGLGLLATAKGTAKAAAAAYKTASEAAVTLGPIIDAATGRCPHCGSQTSKSHQICPKCGRDKLRPTSYYHG